MKTLKIVSALASAMLCLPSQAVDNGTLKDTVVLSGVLMNTFAIANRDHFKPCDHVWQFGYQDAKDQDKHAQTLRASFLRCDMQTADLLPQGMTFSLLPTTSASYWTTDSGPYARSNADMAFVPVGRFGFDLGPVILDASFGLGPALIARTQFADKNKSTNFQFSDEMGIGISDAKRRLRLDFSYRHISNADIKKPNNGMNFVGFGLTYSLE